MNNGTRSKVKKNKDCKVCNDALAKNGDFIACQGCGAKLHYNKCSGVSRDSWKSKGRSARDKWRCIDCRKIKETEVNCSKKKKKKSEAENENNEMESSEDSDDSSEDSESENEIQESDGGSRPKEDPLTITEELKELKKTVKFLASEYDDLKKENGKLKVEMEQLKEEMKKMATSNMTKEKEIGVIQKKIIVQEQYERNRNVEIVGLKKTDKEDLKKIMNKLAKKMKVDGFEEKQIDKIHRVPQRENNKGKEDNIVVQFKTRSDREEWIKKRQTRIVNDDIIENGGQGKVYVNEHLTGHQKYLLWRTREKAKEMDWKYVWIKEGKVLCRKEEGKKCFTIINEEDIVKVVKKD